MHILGQLCQCLPQGDHGEDFEGEDFVNGPSLAAMVEVGYQALHVVKHLIVFDATLPVGLQLEEHRVLEIEQARVGLQLLLRVSQVHVPVGLVEVFTVACALLRHIDHLLILVRVVHVIQLDLVLLFLLVCLGGQVGTRCHTLSLFVDELEAFE